MRASRRLAPIATSPLSAQSQQRPTKRVIRAAVPWLPTLHSGKGRVAMTIFEWRLRKQAHTEPGSPFFVDKNQVSTDSGIEIRPQPTAAPSCSYFRTLIRTVLVVQSIPGAATR